MAMVRQEKGGGSRLQAPTNDENIRIRAENMRFPGCARPRFILSQLREAIGPAITTALPTVP
jgi:hypothetical protein